MTSTDPTVLPDKTVLPDHSLSATFDALEDQLFKTNPTDGPKAVVETADLVRVVTTDLVCWRHQVDDDHTRCAVGAIAEALDDAHLLVVAARRTAPQPWQPLASQHDHYKRMRRHLSDAAGILDWATTMARSVNLKMTIDVQKSIRRDEKGWAIAVSTATLSLRE
ncbi:hypothetical protein AZL_a00510 (plasmid) [Azospirillum sp. B510]|uniref:hypothetical protein n=2 Tax=Alphaproteobacteria TaxID=28211 RepID=UPI0001C4BD0C|nr:hypothetical protein [Azospirillum sp. B510]BAI73582.1 hypothetical protein AZL_a00510 [Azospirillum sp. B510]